MKTKTYNPITEWQIKTIEYQLREVYNVDKLIGYYTGNRVNKISDLTHDEANKLIINNASIERIMNTPEPKGKNQKPITVAQIKKIHVLLQQKGLMEEKETMVNSISNGRTGSTKELTCNEAKQLIDFLLKEDSEIRDKKDRIYNCIWHIAWEMGIIYGDTDEDYQMNRAKLNMFCKERGTVKKNIQDMNLLEMQKTHRQFEAMYKKFKAKNNIV